MQVVLGDDTRTDDEKGPVMSPNSEKWIQIQPPLTR
jgi:hypothetical protein